MVFLAFFIVLIFFAFILARLKLSFIALVSIDSAGLHLNIKIMFYKLLTIFSWNLEDGGLTFLFKKKKDVPEKNKNNKGRLSAVLNIIFSPDTYNNLKRNMEIFDLSIKGRLATKDAALTALLFGGVWGIIGILIPFIPQKHFILDFYPDFQKETPDFHISCILRVRIIHIITLMVNHFKEKMRKGRRESYGTASN